jgi:hypothetical protein
MLDVMSDCGEMVLYGIVARMLWDMLDMILFVGG